MEQLDVTAPQFRQPTMVDMGIVRVIPSKTEAIRRCIRLSSLTQEEVADQLGMTYGHLSRCLSTKSKAHFPPEKEKRLQIVCGNWLVLQWSAYDAGFELMKREKTEVEIMQERIDALEQQLRQANG